MVLLLFTGGKTTYAHVSVGEAPVTANPGMSAYGNVSRAYLTIYSCCPSAVDRIC